MFAVSRFDRLPALIDRAMLGTIRGRYGTPVMCYVLRFACRNVSTSLTQADPYFTPSDN